MPTFPRLGKHGNRSQHGLPEQAAAGIQSSGVGDAAGPGLDAQSALSSTAGSPHEAIDVRQQQQHQLQQQMQQQQQQQGLPILQGPGSSKLPKQQVSTLQQQPQAQLHQAQSNQAQSQAPAPPPHLYSATSTASATNNNPSPLQQHPGGDFVFDARQQQQHSEFVDPTVNRSQSLRYPSQSSLLQQHQSPSHQQQVYGIATSSVDDLPSPASFQQQQLQHQPPPQPAPEKHRTNRKLHIIKGIFGSVRSSSDNSSSSQNSSHAPGSQQHDNIVGFLGRRSSNKRDSRIPPLVSTLRPVPSDDLDNSSFDEGVYQPHPHAPPHQYQQILQQGPGQIISQEQQLQSDHNQSHFDIPSQSTQQQQLHQQILLQQTADGRLPPACYPGSQNPETASQLSHESSAYEQDLRNQTPQAIQLGSAQHVNQQQPPPPQSQSLQQQPDMPPQSSRRSNEAEQPNTGHPPSYRHSNAGLAAASPLPPQGSGVGSGQPAYRGDGRHFEGSDPGRETPQPTAEKEVDSEKAFRELLTKYKNVKRLYFDGKSQIEQLNGQVEQLQNAVANQRLSQSRTALDDSEYATRFSRLNGAIQNLSFNIRKEWHIIPPWLDKFVSPDALKTGKQEMTAVGRAVISRWLATELFDKCFHPDLDPHLSAQLKEIEMGIRGNTHIMHRPEEFDAQTTKVVNWRMATLDGLQKKPNAQATENRAALIQVATANLVGYLHSHLTDPPPPGVEGSTSMIVELAIGVAANLPLESRDVSIWYPMPADTFQPNLMEVEKGELPPLTAANQSSSDPELEEVVEKGGKGQKSKPAAMKEPGRVRFAGFVALEVKGRQVLIKAPVWTL
ncbi:S-adenosylmethionine-dependent methyltransferase-like protein [Beauveria brongniartii RCEF 3172]|uniref:S-adenosylmethionine-dependent methyltransferase-like protein n=1 Tax=Beauveria brongniartii RCEF 3172 TaxID=1081107 RepID=A0A166YIT1_9HYPO|nr:S-adenosylmethionine-dependent methyltransferase-like protein [Beauveria brongniartii RCEF 3172]